MSQPLSKLIWHTSEQRSPEWFAARNGKVTGSVCSPLASVKGKFRDGLSVGAWTLTYKLAGQVLDPNEAIQDEPYQGYWMERGQRLEPHALRAYRAETFNPGHLVGFVEAEGRYAGCSPDFMVSAKKGGEIKCLKMAKHLEWLDSKKLESTHNRQIQWCLFVTGFETWDLVHFHPDAGKGTIDVMTIERDEEMIATFREKLTIIESNIDRIVDKYSIEQPTQLTALKGAQKKVA
jgi:hypothetical protein